MPFYQMVFQNIYAVFQRTTDWKNVVGKHANAKKVIFKACHSGKLKLEYTSPNIISTSPKNMLMSRIDFTVLLLFEFLTKRHLQTS